MADESRDLEDGWREWRDAACNFSVRPVRDSLARIKNYLRSKETLELECKVIKHPNACAACVANEKCELVPLHHYCRCRRGVAFTAKRIQTR